MNIEIPIEQLRLMTIGQINKMEQEIIKDERTN